MSFSDSLKAFRFLSELYERDCGDAVLMTEYPSSNSHETRFQNEGRYIIHDPFPPPPVALLKTLGPHHLMYGWGERLAVTSQLRPDDALLAHWQRSFGASGIPRWQPFEGAGQRHIVSFPFEDIADEGHLMSRDTLYHLHSKHAISDIQCPQAAIFNNVQYPCVMKLSHGYAGLGNFIIDDEADLKAARQKIASTWPDAPIVINEKLENLVGDYGVQFYLHADGSITWLGFTEQRFNETGRWSGGVFNLSVQDKFYPKFKLFADATARYLSANGYYGVVGIDILENRSGDMYLVDLNPRLTGITPFLIAARLFIEQGYEAGLYAPSTVLKGTLGDCIARVERFENAKVQILSGYQRASETICHIGIHGASEAQCHMALEHIIAL